MSSTLSVPAFQVNLSSERALRALSLLGQPGTLRAVLPFDLEVN